MINTYDSIRHKGFKVSKRSKLYRLVVFCNTLGCSLMRNSEFTQDERDYLDYYERFKNLDSEGLFYFYVLRDKFLSHSDPLIEQLGKFFYSEKALNIDFETLIYCSILLNNFDYDYTDFLEKWNNCYFINNDCFFK